MSIKPYFTVSKSKSRPIICKNLNSNGQICGELVGIIPTNLTFLLFQSTCPGCGQQVVFKIGTLPSKSLAATPLYSSLGFDSKEAYEQEQKRLKTLYEA